MIGIVVGLQAEAAIARRLGWPVAIGGGGYAGALEAATRLLAAGATALVSFGLAGGLRPGLPAGTVVTPARIVDCHGGGWSVDMGFARQFGPVSGVVLAARHVIGSAEAKAEAWRTTRADAVDLETAAIVHVAAGRPVAVLRAICDPAGRSLPPAALAALDAAGRIGFGAVMWSVARRPRQISGLVALGREAAAARRALLGRVQAIGSLTDFPAGDDDGAD